MTKMKNDGGPAFPISIPGVGDNGASGMTLRDYFAGQFLVGASSEDQDLFVDDVNDEIEVDLAMREHWGMVARTAYIVADAMISARKGGEA